METIAVNMNCGPSGETQAPPQGAFSVCFDGTGQVNMVPGQCPEGANLLGWFFPTKGILPPQQPPVNQ